MKQQRDSAKASDGFSILEMLVVLAIAAVVSGLLGWGLNRLNKRQTPLGLASAITELLRTAHWRSMRSGVSHKVTFNLDERTVDYQLATVPIKIPDFMRFKLTIGSELRESSGTATIDFLPDGTSSGGMVEISAGEAFALVRVNWISGLAEIDDEN